MMDMIPTKFKVSWTVIYEEKLGGADFTPRLPEVKQQTKVTDSAYG